MLQGNVVLTFAVGALEILSCDMVQHVLTGVILQELCRSRCIYQPGSARKVLCNTLCSLLLLCMLYRFPSTKQFCSTYQCTLALDIQLAHPLISWLCYRAMILHTLNSFQPSTETVAVCKAIMSENCTLVNCGDYVDCVSHMNR